MTGLTSRLPAEASPVTAPVRLPSRRRVASAVPSWDLGKSEAVAGRDLEDKDVKGQLGAAAVGAGIGGLVGGIVGGLVPGGALIGGILGGVVGAVVGLVIGGRAARRAISWLPPAIAVTAAGGDSTTLEKPFVPVYTAKKDDKANLWRLQVTSITGGADISIHTGGSRDPIASPPISQAEAADAVTVMKAYYGSGRGSWHTEAASRAHELYHYDEWQCSSEHFWGPTLGALENLTAPAAAHPTGAAAVAAMRAGPAGADAKLARFAKAAHDYWFTLSDKVANRPYAAGQLVLNSAIRHVQGLADSKGWVVAQGVDTPSKANPCYQPWPPYAP